MIESKCKNCDINIFSHKSENRVFCSKKCYAFYRFGNQMKICKQCGVDFKRRRKETIYCSRKCTVIAFEKNHYKNGTCKMCKNIFKQKTYQDLSFCSKDCLYKSKQGKNSPTWKGGIKKDKDKRKSLEMVEWRKAVFERDQYTCQICDKKSVYLEPHHIFFYAKFPDLRSNLHNGITLCKSCHTYVHKSIRRTYFSRIDKQQLQIVVRDSKYRDWLFEVLSHNHKM